VDDGTERRTARLWVLARDGSLAAILAGVGLAFASAGAGAAVIAAAACVLVVSQIWIALAHYRRVMARPWPAVAPLPDDDDDW
jgi:hypothetical protein